MPACSAVCTPSCVWVCWHGGNPPAPTPFIVSISVQAHNVAPVCVGVRTGCTARAQSCIYGRLGLLPSSSPRSPFAPPSFPPFHLRPQPPRSNPNLWGGPDFLTLCQSPTTDAPGEERGAAGCPDPYPVPQHLVPPMPFGFLPDLELAGVSQLGGQLSWPRGPPSTGWVATG